MQFSEGNSRDFHKSFSKNRNSVSGLISERKIKKISKGIKKRASGVILHITSLPSGYGIGDFGPKAFRFVDFLRDCGQTYWQVLPLNPTEQIFGNSPYSSVSAYAGNLNLISPEILINDGFLKKEESRPKDNFPVSYCDYAKVIPFKHELLEKAYFNFKKNGKQKKTISAILPCQP